MRKRGPKGAFGPHTRTLIQEMFRMIKDIQEQISEVRALLATEQDREICGEESNAVKKEEE